MQLEELLDKLKKKKTTSTKKNHDIAIKPKTCNVIELRILSIMFNKQCNCKKKGKRKKETQ